MSKTLSNQEVEFLFSWLNIPLHGELLRHRNKFISIVESQHNSTNHKREELLDKYADKDESGKMIVENGLIKMSEDNRKLFEHDFLDYLENGSVDYGIPNNVCAGIKEILTTKIVKGLNIEEGKIFESIIEELDMV